MTPTIVKDEDYQPTETKYLQTPVPKKDVLEGEWSAWDSGKPKDWSKKAADPEFKDPQAQAKEAEKNAVFQDPQPEAKQAENTPVSQDPQAQSKAAADQAVFQDPPAEAK